MYGLFLPRDKFLKNFGKPEIFQRDDLLYTVWEVSAMKEYKIIETSKRNAEKLMNEMTKQGWEVVSTSLWRKLLTYSLLIIFSKEK